MMTDANTAPAKLHPFEQAGLGKAPYRFVGSFESKFQACQGAPIQPGSSCDYCGTGIMIVCNIRSADGVTFKVGCDCLEKIADACAKTDLERAARELYAAAMKPIRARQAAQRKARAEAKAADTAALLEDPTVRATLKALPHPSIDRPGYTLLSWVEWMLAHAGAKGKTAAAKAVREALGGTR